MITHHEYACLYIILITQTININYETDTVPSQQVQYVRIWILCIMSAAATVSKNLDNLHNVHSINSI